MISRRALISIAAILTLSTSVSAQSIAPRDDLCIREGDSYLGIPITVTYEFPLDPPTVSVEDLPDAGGLFPNPPGGSSGTGGPSCGGGGIVGALSCVAEQIANAGAAAAAAAATAGASAADEVGNSDVADQPEQAPTPVTVTMELQPMLSSGSPPRVIYRPKGDAKITRPESLTDENVAQIARTVAAQGRSIAEYSQPLNATQLDNLRNGNPLELTPPITAPGATATGSTEGLRMPAECNSLFRAENELLDLRDRRTSIRDRIKMLKDMLKKEREKGGLLGLVWDSAEADRLERIIAHEERRLAAVDRQIAEKTSFIQRRANRVREDVEDAEIAAIKADPQRLAAEEARRRQALIDAAREAARFKWMLIEGEQQYAQSIAAYDARIARAEAEGNDAYADSLREDKARLERTRDSWKESYEGMYSSRLKDQQRLIKQNREDGIGPTQDATSVLLADGENPIEVLESGARDAARESMARRVGTDSTTLGGTATEDYTFEDFARDLGDSNAEMWENPELFADRYGHFWKGVGEGTADAVKDLAVMAVEAGDTAGEAFESALTDVTGYEFNAFGRENLDALVRAGDAISDADALKIGDKAADLARAVDRRIEQMAGQGEKGIERALEGAGYATATVFAAEEAAIRAAVKGAQVVDNVVDIVRGVDAVSDLARAGDAVTDVARATDAATDVARATDAAADVARATDAATDAARATDAATDAARATDSATDVARASDTAANVENAGEAASNLPTAARATESASDANRTTEAATGADTFTDLDSASLDATRIETPATPEVATPSQPSPTPDAPESGGLAGALDGSRSPETPANGVGDTTIIEPAPRSTPTPEAPPRNTAANDTPSAQPDTSATRADGEETLILPESAAPTTPARTNSAATSDFGTNPAPSNTRPTTNTSTSTGSAGANATERFNDVLPTPNANRSTASVGDETIITPTPGVNPSPNPATTERFSDVLPTPNTNRSATSVGDETIITPTPGVNPTPNTPSPNPAATERFNEILPTPDTNRSTASVGDETIIMPTPGVDPVPSAGARNIGDETLIRPTEGVNPTPDGATTERFDNVLPTPEAPNRPATSTGVADNLDEGTVILDNPLAGTSPNRPVPPTPEGQHNALREAIAQSDDLTDAQKGMFDAMTRGNRTPERAAAEAIVNGGLDAEDVLRAGVTGPDDLRRAMAGVLDDLTDHSPAEINKLIDDATARTGDTLRQNGVNDTAAKIAEDKVGRYGSDYATAAIGYAQDVHPSKLIESGRFTEDGLRKGLDDYLLNERHIADAAERQRLIDNWMAPPSQRRPVEFNAADGTPRDPSAKHTTDGLADGEINVRGQDGTYTSYQTGETLGEGSTSAAYRDRDNPNGVVRINHPVGHTSRGADRAVELEDIQKAQAVDDMGRRGLDEAYKDSAYLEPVWVYRSDTLPDGRRVEAVQMAPGDIAADMLDQRARQALPEDQRALLDQFDEIEAGGGKLSDAQAAERARIEKDAKALRRFEPDEAEALAGSISDLNDKGYIVLDGHVHNFSVVRDGDGVRVAFLDPGGIVPVKGADPAMARQAQQRVFEVPGESMGDLTSRDIAELMYPEMRGQITDELKDVIDYDAFADAPVAINPDSLAFRPSLGFEHPEVLDAFLAFE